VIMQVRDIMTPNPSVVTRSETVARAAALMRDRHIGMLPVVDDLHSRRLVGVVTDRDIIVRGVAHERDVDGPVRDLMTSAPLAVTYVDRSPDEVVGLMERRQLRRIPVLDDRERVVGIVASIDVSKRFVRRRTRASDPDRAVHEVTAR
jgi:CBS domain-containing protein